MRIFFATLFATFVYLGTSEAIAENVRQDPSPLIHYDGVYRDEARRHEPEQRELRLNVPGEFFSPCGRLSFHFGENTGAALGYTDYSDNCTDPDYQFRVGGSLNSGAFQLRFFVKCWLGCKNDGWN